MRILAIDPGSEQSAFVVLNHSCKPIMFDKLPNEELLDYLRLNQDSARVVVIEKVEGYGMPVGAEIFETVYWSGRFAEACRASRVERIGRKAVKVHLCGTTKAKDPNVRQALIDRYSEPGRPAIGLKASPGPLHGLRADLWAALAVGVTFADTEPA